MEESTQPKKLTTASGRPIFDNQNSQSAGARGPLLLQDYFLHEKSAHFNRERIPERVVHAKGSGAYGKFTVTHDITHLTRAKLFSKVGNECKMFTRFSTVGGEVAIGNARKATELASPCQITLTAPIDTSTSFRSNTFKPISNKTP